MNEKPPQDQLTQQERQAAMENGRKQNDYFKYPVAEKDLIEDMREAESDPEKLRDALDEALAYTEGLEFGTRFYDPEDEHDRTYLYNEMMTVEGATEVPQAIYLNSGVAEILGGAVREVKRRAAKEGRRELTESEGSEKQQFMALENYRMAREAISIAFRQRMLTVGSAEDAGDLAVGKIPFGSREIVSAPDKTHWRTYFHGKRGETINNVLNKMVDAGAPAAELAEIDRTPIPGIPANIYAMGFNDQKVDGRQVKGTALYRDWLKVMLKEAGGRMDIVWSAWQLFLTWELPGSMATTIKTTPGEKGKPDVETIAIGDPVVVSDLDTWALNTNTKRFVEFTGGRIDGTRRNERYMTHSGYPNSIDFDSVEGDARAGKGGGLCGNFLEHSKVKVRDGSGKETEKTLMQIWRKDGISLASDKFPWESTEFQPTEDIDEVPPASFAGWLLTRRRAVIVSADLRSRPAIKDLISGSWWEERMRNWDKVPGGKIKENSAPGDNLRSKWLFGCLSTRISPASVRTVSGEYRYLSHSDFLGEDRIDKSGTKVPSVYQVLEAALEVGFIRIEDFIQIREKLNLSNRRNPLSR